MRRLTLEDDTGFAGQGNRARDAEHDRPLRRARDLRIPEAAARGGKADLPFLGAGIFLTGGSSLLEGIDHLAEEIFEMPVHITHAQTVSGLTSAFENPQLSTAIGLIKYAGCHAARAARRSLRTHSQEILHLRPVVKFLFCNYPLIFISAHQRRRTPKAFYQSAQGCEERATLGGPQHHDFNPEGVESKHTRQP